MNRFINLTSNKVILEELTNLIPRPSGQFKSYYVDPVDGDDNNTGSSDQPFKTLKKAITSAPLGGYTSINLLKDYTAKEGAITLYNSYIELTLKGKLTINTHISGSYSILDTHINMVNSAFVINIDSNNKGKLELTKTTDKPLAPTHQGLFLSRKGTNTLEVDLMVQEDNYNPIKLNGVGFMTADTWSYKRHNFNFALSGHYKGNNRDVIVDNTMLVYTKTVPCSVYIKWENNFVDNNGNVLNPSNLIDGIVKDSDGKPRNITSNLIL